MADPKIPIKKLTDGNNKDFYPLASDEGVAITNPINVRNILGGEGLFNPQTGEEGIIPAPDDVLQIPWTVHELLKRILGTRFKDIVYKDIDDSTAEDLSDDDEHLPTSKLVKRLIQNILVANIDKTQLTDSYDYIPSSKLMRLILNGDGKLKFKVLSYDEYQHLVNINQIQDDVLYFTWGGSSQYLEIIFNGNGGTISINQQESFLLHMTNGNTLGEGLSNYGISGLPSADLEEYSFNGWYTDREAGIKVTEEYVPHTNMTLYARWVTIDGDFLCLEEDYSVNILTEDLLYLRLEYFEDLEGILLATEVDHTLIVTEDNLYYISLAISDGVYLVTEVERDPIITEDQLYYVSLLATDDVYFVTEIDRDPIVTENDNQNISVLAADELVFATESDFDPVMNEDRSSYFSRTLYDVSESVGRFSIPSDTENQENSDSNTILLTASAPVQKTVQKASRNVITLTATPKLTSVPVSSVSTASQTQEKSHITVMKVIFGEPEVIINPKSSEPVMTAAVFTPLPDNFTKSESNTDESNQKVVKPRKRRGRKRKSEV